MYEVCSVLTVLTGLVNEVPVAPGHVSLGDVASGLPCLAVVLVLLQPATMPATDACSHHPLSHLRGVLVGLALLEGLGSLEITRFPPVWGCW